MTLKSQDGAFLRLESGSLLSSSSYRGHQASRFLTVANRFQMDSRGDLESGDFYCLQDRRP